MVVVIGAW